MAQERFNTVTLQLEPAGASSLMVLDVLAIEKSLQENKPCVIPKEGTAIIEAVTNTHRNINLGVLSLTQDIKANLLTTGRNVARKKEESTVAGVFEIDLSSLKEKAEEIKKATGDNRLPSWVSKATPLEMFFAQQAVAFIRSSDYDPSDVSKLHLTIFLSRSPRLLTPVSSVNTRFRR